MRNTHSFKMNLPEMSDPVDVRELNDNFLVIDDALMAGLCKKELTTNNMGSSDPASRKYGWAPWIEIYNGNEFDVVVIDRNAPDLPSGTINIEAGGTYRMFINGTYYMNFYVQDQHDVTFKWFTNAETRINEIEPSGGGGVSSVNVTGASGSHIESSGGPVTDTGTIELSISTGYSIPSDDEQTAWDSKAADLKLEINSSTFVITAQLKDASGNLIGNERTIDLPLETMVVDGEYDPQTQKIKLELKNGNYVEFSVADLVSGLQTELNDTDNKLDPTYIAYDASHREVSDTEKSTWNAKQNAISDLETIRSGASAGATAVQPSEMNSALATKQNTIDSSHKLASSLVSFGTVEAAAIASGIDSSKVGQISTNQTNILSVQNDLLAVEGNKIGVNNFNIGAYVTNPDITVVGDSLTVNKTVTLPITVPKTGKYYLLANVSNVSVGSGGSAYLFIRQSTTNLLGITFSTTGDISGEFTVTDVSALSFLFSFNSASVTIKDIMIVSEEAYNAGFTSYQPYALPNYDLTVREAEDRNALVEQVDSGAKNELRIRSDGVYQLDTITLTVANGIITCSGTASASKQWFDINIDRHFSGNYIFSGCPVSPSGRVTMYCQYTDDWAWFGLIDNSDVGVEVNFDPSRTLIIRCQIYANTDPNGLVFKPMLCRKADWNISHAFVPYALPNTDLTRMVGTLFPTTYTAPVVNSDISSKLSILSGGYAKAGNLVTVNLRLSVTDTIAAGSALFTGLPEPKTTAELSYGSAVVPVTNMCVNAQVSPNVMLIDTQGTIRLAGTPASSDITTGIYILSATYLSA